MTSLPIGAPFPKVLRLTIRAGEADVKGADGALLVTNHASLIFPPDPTLFSRRQGRRCRNPSGYGRLDCPAQESIAPFAAPEITPSFLRSLVRCATQATNWP